MVDDSLLLPVPKGRVLVVTMDQRGSRTQPDAVASCRRRLNASYTESLVRSFVRLAGDEMQAVADDAGWIVDLVLTEARRERWWIGVGYGEYEAPLGRSARDSRGEAFYLAREAVARAKSEPWAFAIEGPEMEDVELALALTRRVVCERTKHQHEAVELLRTERQTQRVAERLGISVQAASQRIRGAGLEEETAGRRLARTLLERALEGVA